MFRAIEVATKALLRPIWRLSGPVRRPLTRKFDAHLQRIVDLSIANALAANTQKWDATAAALGRIEESVNVGRHVVEHQNSDANLLLDGMIREVARLQRQIESLRDAIEEAQSHGTLAVVRDNDEAERLAG